MPTCSVKAVTFRASQDGATAIEYALIASAVALAIVTPLAFMGDQLGSTYETIGSLMSFM